MGIDVTEREKEQLEAAQYLIRPLAGANGMHKATYHNPQTGQEFPALPTDPRSLQLYTLVKGWRLGPAPAELKAKWEAGAIERAAKSREAEAEARRTHPVEIREDFKETPMFKTAVKDAVIEALREMGIEKPDTPLGNVSAKTPDNVTPISAARGRSPVETVGTPTETKSKLMVSDVLLDEGIQAEKG